MNISSGNRGFMKALVVFTVGICVIFIFLFYMAQNFSSGSFSGLANISNGSNYTAPYQGGQNPLLNFGGSSYDPGFGEYERSIPNVDGTLISPYANSVSLSGSNARSTAQPYEEYISIRNTGAPVNITGWTVTNGKGSRPVENRQNDYFYPTAESGIIGTGTEYLSPDGNFQVGPIVLKKGDIAYLVTGKPYSQFPFSIYTNFRENICVGYLTDYPFSPSVSKQCPFISNDPQIRTVTDECYDYIRTLSSCENPERTDKVNLDAVTTQCKAFVTARSNYEGCVAYNGQAANFSTNIWRVFLGKDRELWASSRETITLYDAQGLIVDRLTY